MSDLQGILDPQPGNLALAVFDGNKLLLHSDCPMHGRDAAILPDFVAAELKKIDLQISDITRWTVGSGPGSFTFLRLVAALAAGWKFANDAMSFRSVPGALALAGASAIADGETCGVLYDGRNKEILYFGAKKCDGKFESTGVTAVLNCEQAKEFFAARNGEKQVCFECEKSAIEAILPETATVTAVVPELSALAENSTVAFDNNLDNLVYIRPAVFS
ncbi:MAG: hypothetical protein J6R86_06800 [Lentisphaeria bacterium]|nr:hypothetical protein [Lentisphaeria bacterium]